MVRDLEAQIAEPEAKNTTLREQVERLAAQIQQRPGTSGGAT